MSDCKWADPVLPLRRFCAIHMCWATDVGETCRVADLEAQIQAVRDVCDNNRIPIGAYWEFVAVEDILHALDGDA